MASNAIWTKQGPRRALITGASGGIGEAFARILAAEGWELAISARNADELNRVAGVLHGDHGVPVMVVPADLGTPEGVEKLCAQLSQRQFHADVLINNAGFGRMGAALELAREEQLAIIDVNVRAAVDLVLRMLPYMRQQGAGGVLNVASLAAFMPGPGMAAYHASKAALLSFSEALAEELRHEGITITALCPGPVKTAFQERAGMTASRIVRWLPSASAHAVARAGWQGFKEGRVVVVPGMIARMLAASVRFSPRPVVRRVAAFFSGVHGRRAQGQKQGAGKKQAGSAT